MRYEDFVDKGYKPKRTDAVCSFYIEPNRVSMKYAAGGVAAESSVGTWTDLKTMHKYVERIAATVFEIKGDKKHADIRIAYPQKLFEPGNIANILSSVAGNVFGLKELRNLRLNDIVLPKKLVKSFKGPRYGIKGIRDILDVHNRPFVGTIIKPKLGLRTSHHARIAYDAWIGGCDIVKDDENLSSQKFNTFYKRIRETLKMRDLAEKKTRGVKAYLPNITAETDEMIRRAKYVKEHGGRYAMLDILTVGWSGLQTLRNHSFGLIIHGHRAMHAAITKNPKHGISMKVFAKLARIVGVDQLHVGTAVGKMAESREEVLENIKALKEKMYGVKKVMPVASGGLHPSLIPEEVKLFGNDVIIQMGGGIHGNPMGTKAGAKAARQALSAVKSKISLKSYASEHKELKAAIEKWG
jgi:ribulose-bisphosphate carboxylase large chain